MIDDGYFRFVEGMTAKARREASSWSTTRRFWLSVATAAVVAVIGGVAVLQTLL